MGGDGARLDEPGMSAGVTAREVGLIVDLCLRDLDHGPLLALGTTAGPFAPAFAARGWAVTSRAPAGALPFADGAFDLAFLDRALSAADDPQTLLREAHRIALRRVVLLEWPYQAEDDGPPLRQRLRREFVETLAAAAGFGQVVALPLARRVLYLLLPAPT